MAKVKKEISIEEAIIPENEQPYIIPDNWAWVHQSYVCMLSDGEKKHGEQHPYLEVKYLRGVIEPDIKNSGKFVKAGSNLILVDGENSGEIFKINESGYMGSTFKTLSVSEKVDESYLLWFIHSKHDLLKSNKTGSAIPHLNKKLFLNLPFPLPPLNEQLRIAEQIENLFSKLDEAKEKAQFIIDQYKIKRESMIHLAFIGELTKSWRKKHNVSIADWENKKIKDICYSLKYGSSQKSSPEGSVIVLRMGNLQEGEIDWTNLAYTNDEKEIEKYLLRKGDVLFNRTNSPELVGKTSIYRGEYPAVYAGYLIKLDYNHDLLNGEYLNFMLNSPEAKEYCNSVKSDGVNQSNINAQKIGAFEIPIPNIDEQCEIVRILDEIISKEKSAKILAESVIENVDTLKKSILSKAFRGEL